MCVCMKALQCLPAFISASPLFSYGIIVITHVKMCPSIFYHSFASFHLSVLKIAANG